MTISRLASGIIVFVLALFISSCAITEEIWFEKNGSGKLEMNVDMSSMIQVLAMMDTTGQGMGDAEMDTTIYFGEALRDKTLDLSSIQNTDLLDKISMDMTMNEENQEMLVKMNIDFEHLDEIPKILEVMKQVKALRDSTNTDGNPFERATALMDQGGLGFTFENGLLVRDSQPMDDDTMEDEEMSAEDIEMMTTMFGEMKYSSIIHLPGKIKSISAENAEKVDDKTIRIEYDLMKMMEMKEVPGYQIKFKKK